MFPGDIEMDIDLNWVNKVTFPSFYKPEAATTGVL